MSAIGGKADIAERQSDVRFVPTADIASLALRSNQRKTGSKRLSRPQSPIFFGCPPNRT
jgi:hypothetical protein